MERGADSRTCGWYLGHDGQFPLLHWYNGTPLSPTRPHVLESAPRSNFPLILFIKNQKHKKYEIHGTLAQNAKTCQHCELQSQAFISFFQVRYPRCSNWQVAHKKRPLR